MTAGAKTRVRIRLNAHIFMDMGMWVWPRVPHAEPTSLFAREPIAGQPGWSWLTADNFGNPYPAYGNGKIAAKDTDLLWVQRDHGYDWLVEVVPQQTQKYEQNTG